MSLNRNPALDKQYVVYQADDGAQFYLRKDRTIRGALMEIAGDGTFQITRADDSDAVLIELLEPAARGPGGVSYGGATLLHVPPAIRPRYLNLQYIEQKSNIEAPQSHADVICSFVSDWDRFVVGDELWVAQRPWIIAGKQRERQLRGR